MNVEDYAKRSQFYSTDIPQMLSRNLEAAEWHTCLDIGCGDGALLSALNILGAFHGKTVLAVDISANRIELVKKINNDFTCFVSDACKTPITTNSVDFLISTQMIEHVDDDNELAREMYRILSDDGLLYLSTIIKKRYAWYFYRCNGKWVLDPTHVREYTKESQLLDLLESQGFEILENKKTLDSRPLMDAILRRLHAPRGIYHNRFLRFFRKIKIPIPGYYQWELACRKMNQTPIQKSHE